MLKEILDMFLQKSLETGNFFKADKTNRDNSVPGYKERLECFSPGGRISCKIGGYGRCITSWLFLHGGITSGLASKYTSQRNK